MKKTCFDSQVGSLNACFFAKRNFQVDVYEAREGKTILKIVSCENSDSLTSFSLDFKKKAFFRKRSLVLFCFVFCSLSYLNLI